MKRKRITRIRIPLEDLSKTEREVVEKTGGRYIITIADEPCLTCGHKTRVCHVERSDGKRTLVKECLYCMCKHPTVANRSAP